MATAVVVTTTETAAATPPPTTTMSAGPAPPPPPSYLDASSAGVVGVVGAVGAGDAEGGAPSSSQPLRVSSALHALIVSISEEHAALHAEIAPLTALPSLAARTQEDLYTLRGKLTSLDAASRRLDAQCSAAEASYRRVKKRFVAMGRKRKRLAALSHWDGLREECARNDADATAMRVRIASTEAALGDARAGSQSLRILEAELDALDARVFAGPTPDFPSEDALEGMAAVLASTLRLLAAESERELRARPKLQKSLAPLQIVLAKLREALAITLDAGVPTDTKYTRQLLVNGSPLTISKRVTPLIQRAKTESGKGHTLFAEARGIQLLVKRLPTLTLLDLNRLPSKASGIDIATSMSERSMHAALETSYAQSQRQVAHVKKEIEKSRRRTEFFRKRIERLRGEQERVKGVLRDKRRRIVVDVSQGGGASVRHDDDDDGDVAADLADTMDAAFDFRGDDDNATIATVTEGGDAGEGGDVNGGDGDGDGETAAVAGAEAETEAEAAVDTTVEETPTSTSGKVNSADGVAAAAAAVAAADLDELPPILANPHLATGATASDDADASSPLSATTIARRSTRALRRIIRECVREVNAYDEADPDELPGYQYAFA